MGLPSLRALAEACGDDDRLKDTLKGGPADQRDPSEFNQLDLMHGVHVEFEHTDDILIAMEIAMDHLEEDPNYYKKSVAIEGQEVTPEMRYFVSSKVEGRRESNLKRVYDRVWKGKQ